MKEWNKEGDECIGLTCHECWVHRRNVELSGESDLDGNISGDEKKRKGEN